VGLCSVFGAGLPTSLDPAETPDRRSPIPEIQCFDCQFCCVCVVQVYCQVSHEAGRSGVERERVAGASLL